MKTSELKNSQSYSNPQETNWESGIHKIQARKAQPETISEMAEHILATMIRKQSTHAQISKFYNNDRASLRFTREGITSTQNLNFLNGNAQKVIRKLMSMAKLRNVINDVLYFEDLRVHLDGRTHKLHLTTTSNATTGELVLRIQRLTPISSGKLSTFL